jgi:hypothetical protein
MAERALTTCDPGEHMEAVARELLGEPNPHHSKGTDLRFGSNGSMSVNLDKGVFYSHQDKQGGGVLDLIKREKGLERTEAISWMRDTLGLEVARHRDRPMGAHHSGDVTKRVKPKKETEATYNYTDEGGGSLFQTVRQVFRNPDGTLVMTPEGKPAKTFLQRHHDPESGELIWSLRGVRLVPYRLPELIGAVAGGQIVFIVEGEQKVDLLRRLGLQATCNPMGAGKWPKEFTRYFAGANVVILPDNDPQAKKEDCTLRFHADSRPVLPGQDHAQMVAGFLHGTANSVKVLMLPDLPVKGDVKEWFAANHTVHELLELAEDAPEYGPGEAFDQVGDYGPPGEADAASPKPTPGEHKSNGHTKPEHPDEGVTIDDFHAYMPMHSYIFAPTGEMWPASSVNSRVPPVQVSGGRAIGASAWLDQNKPVEQMTWAPGRPKLIPNRLIADGGWIERNGVATFNLYRPPTIQPGAATKAGPWLDHVQKVYGDDAEHIIKWLAHRVRRPEEKINHALVLGGQQGIGKDTLLEPVKHAIGPWNFAEVSPQQLLGRFNGFIKSVILRVSEARDLGDTDRFKFYDHMKAYTAAPPDVLRVDEKHLREHNVLNCVGAIITTNYKSDGIHLPSDDRRHFVAWSPLTKEDFAFDYWPRLWGWYDNGGIRHVAAYLATLDISTFDPKAPPPKTQAFWDIVATSQAPEDAELADALDDLGNPDATTLLQIECRAPPDLAIWLRDRRNRRAIPHRLEKCGYVAVHNDSAQDRLWKINGARRAIYAKSDLSARDRLQAANLLYQQGS